MGTGEAEGDNRAIEAAEGSLTYDDLDPEAPVDTWGNGLVGPNPKDKPMKSPRGDRRIAMRDGRSAEVATVGREGAVGGVVSSGFLPASTNAVVQIGGPVLRLDALRLQEVKRSSPALRNLFTHYADCLLAQVLQSVACNALHPIESRCLRWLLTFQDRLGTPVLPVTQEMLAEMLGVSDDTSA